MVFAPGDVIEGRYRIEALLNQGGMGSVYRAYQLSLARPVALKILRPDSPWKQSPNIEARFLREATLSASLLHPNIISVFDYGVWPVAEEYVPFLVMEYIEGHTLTQLLKRERMLSPKLAVELFSQMARGLSYAHQKGVVHRDIKPDNVLLQEAELGATRAKLVDFGLGRHINDQTRITTANTFVGSPNYMSPEQIQHGNQIDHRSDLYSLGVVLYQCLCGRLPFRDKSPVNVMVAHTAQAPPPLRESNPNCNAPPELEALVMALLEKNPNHRPTSAGELLARLEPLRDPQAGRNAESTQIQISIAGLGRAEDQSGGRAQRTAEEPETPSLWALVEDPAMRSESTRQILEQLSEYVDVFTIPPEEYANYLASLQHKTLTPPWVLLFGDLHVLSQDKMLSELQYWPWLKKVLFSTHDNFEMLKISVNACGPDYHVSLPEEPSRIVARILELIGEVQIAKKMYRERLGSF